MVKHTQMFLYEPDNFENINMIKGCMGVKSCSLHVYKIFCMQTNLHNMFCKHTK